MAASAPTPFGRFQLHQRLGAGGMGEVFRAEMHGPDGFARQVVVKRMLRELTSDQDAVTMFVDEARLAARLIHPNVVQIYDFGKISGRYYLVMELVQGCDLSYLLSYFAEQKETMPQPAGLVIIAALLEALGYVHEVRDDRGRPLGLVHRDVSPA